ncbi:response regulator [Brasilonema sp. CT11]|nr:response regulator [Brasilonema sp. CT11]
MNKASISILLVEDNPSDAKLLQQTLWHLGKEKWRVVHLERLNDALKACSKNVFDLVLLDLSLPDSQGLNTLAKFSTTAPNIPTVVLTGFDDEDIALQAVANSVQDYLVKGQITPNLLEHVIRYAIERRQILNELRECQHRLQGVFEQTSQSIVLLTCKGMIVEMNQSALNLWRTQQDCVGKPLWSLESWNLSSVNPGWLKSIIAKAADGEFLRHELQLRSANDFIQWIDFSVRPLKDETGKVVLLIVEACDVSEQKRAEAEMIKAWQQERELNEMKSNFVSMVSHEFRNPMSVIRTAVELLESYNHQLSDPQRSKYFGKIQTAIRQMQQLLDEVLFWGRSDAGKLQYEPTLLDLEHFCSDLTQTLQLSASGKHQIIFRFQGKRTPVLVDENLLRYILTNLLSNAIKYSPQGGVIRFDVICQDDAVTFQIQDFGIGIPIKDQQLLFETFHRASNVGSIPGTGLGLSIVKKCVELHQGQIDLESQVGVGTTFTVKLSLNHQSLQSLELIESGSDLQSLKHKSHRLSAGKNA